MARHDQVSRILTVLRLLEGNPRGFTLKQLHDRISADYEVNERNLRRDVDALENLGYDIQREENSDDGVRAKVIKLNPTVKITRQLVLSPGELLALYFARNLLAPLKETAFYEDLEKVFRQIDLLLREKDREHLKEISTELRFEPGPRWGLGIQPDIVDTVRAACSNSQILQFIYQSTNSKSETMRRVGPHFLYFAKGSLYLVGEDFKDNKVKIFSLPRVRSAEMTDEVYEGNKVDPEKYFSNSFGVFRAEDQTQIRLLFSPEIAAYVKERRWHGSQRVVSKADGTIELNLEVGITPDLIQWILGFGSKVEVLGPLELRQQLQAAAEEVVQKYSTAISSTNKKSA